MNTNMSLRSEFDELYNSYLQLPHGLRCLDIEGISPDKLDIGANSFKYFNDTLADISTDSNSNVVENYSPTTYRNFICNNQMKLLGYFMLWHYTEKRYGRRFADEALRLIWDGDLYFHDAHGVKIQMPYCYAFSLGALVIDGRPYGSSPNTPPKYRKSFLSQVDKLISDLSKDFAGATAPSDLIFWYSYFCQKEGIDPWRDEGRREIIQDMQGLICLFNEPSRAEGESPFTNIGIYDETGLANLFGHTLYPDGSKPNMDYIMAIQEVFCDWFKDGDPISEYPYRFPVVTFNATTDAENRFLHPSFMRMVAHCVRPKAAFNVHFGDKAKLAMCCRYENDLDDMGMSPDSFGNGGVNIGSHRVITINFPRIALKYHSLEKFYNRLNYLFGVAAKLLIVHRYDILENRIKKNPSYLKFFGKLKWFNMKTMFSTFGLTGLYECCEFMGYNITEPDGTDFMLDMLSTCRAHTKALRQEYGIPFNMEEIPGEQACVSLLQKDKACGLILNDADIYLYSNQYIPLTAPVDMIDRIELSGKFMSIVSGGGIVHLNVGTQIDSDEKVYDILSLCAHHGVNHVAICYRFGKCKNGHTKIVGQATECPVCDAPIIKARNRVIGYYSDEDCWHPVRREHDAHERYFQNVEDENE